MRKLDGKFHIDGEKIVKTSNNEEIPEDEPVMIIRARDYLALPLLHHYKRLCLQDNCTDYQMGGIDDLIDAFFQFSYDNPAKMKQPGITRGL